MGETKEIEYISLFSNRTLLVEMRCSPKLLYITYLISSVREILTGSHKREYSSNAKLFF